MQEPYLQIYTKSHYMLQMNVSDGNVTRMMSSGIIIIKKTAEFITVILFCIIESRNLLSPPFFLDLSLSHSHPDFRNTSIHMAV